MNGVCSLREATYCSNPFEIFYEKNNLVLLVSKKRFTPLLQFNGCWSLIEFLFFFWVNNEFHSSTQVEIKLFQLKEIQILWELLEMQMHYGQFWIQKEAKNAAKMLKKKFSNWSSTINSHTILRFKRSSKCVNKSYSMAWNCHNLFRVKNCLLWNAKVLSTERYIHLSST